mmetsp:Transcript_2466/g.3986  ORF Transcript_2466/g.3986 Transcript_2466/m.3986 type:complete len:262 (+) Transcript_2466:786-1571(+)
MWSRCPSSGSWSSWAANPPQCSLPERRTARLSRSSSTTARRAGAPPGRCYSRTASCPASQPRTGSLRGGAPSASPASTRPTRCTRRSALSWWRSAARRMPSMPCGSTSRPTRSRARRWRRCCASPTSPPTTRPSWRPPFLSGAPSRSRFGSRCRGPSRRRTRRRSRSRSLRRAGPLSSLCRRSTKLPSRSRRAERASDSRQRCCSASATPSRPPSPCGAPPSASRRRRLLRPRHSHVGCACTVGSRLSPSPAVGVARHTVD